MSRATNTAGDNLLFKPGIIRNKNPSSPVRSMTLGSVNSTGINLTGSFRYDSPGAALKSTQQLLVDWAQFSNHTFFNSARAKVQKAFDKIINRYPFDGTQTEVYNFVDSLTGFEKYVLDQFPKHSGYLAFSGSSSTSSPGTYISVVDFEGSNISTLLRDSTGQPVLDPGTKPFSFEFYINVPSGTINDNQIVAQKLSGSNGVTLLLSSSADKSSTSGTVDFLTLIRSGSTTMSASVEINKGEFVHCASVFDKSAGPGRIKIYRNGILISSSSESMLGAIDFKTSPLTIGSGSSHDLDHYDFVPVETLSGAMDELRVWHTARTQKEVQTQRFQDVFSQKDLKLLYRFNEPSGTYSGSVGSLALDHSGNGLHATVQNFDIGLRNTGTFGSSPVTGETDLTSVVLFPSFESVIDLNVDLMSSASDYDTSNPNIVTRLIPPHYFLDASANEGFVGQDANIENDLSRAYDQPGGALVGQPQIIAGLLFTFAETFDEMKMFVDEFKRLLKVDVLSQEVISDQLLPWLSRYYGISLPNFYSNASMPQLMDGSNVRRDRANTTSLQLVQNTLWRRVFSDLPFLFSTRGTHSSIRSLLSNMGISPDGPIRIREFGGSKQRNLGDSYIRRHETAAMLDMSGTYNTSGTLNYQGIDDNRPYLQGSFLSGTRVEPGIPLMAGSLVGTGSDDTSDGLYTSGSWTIEGVYKFDNKRTHFVTQSLARLYVTGTEASASKHGVLFNMVAYKPDVDSSITGTLRLYGRPSSGSAASTLQLNLTGVNIFDGQKWQVSFGRNRNDLIDSYVTSSYFLRAGKFSPGGLEEFITTSSYFDDTATSALQNVAAYNTSGAFMVLGSQSLDTSTNNFLNATSVDSSARSTKFSGRMAALRFWSKGLTKDETKTHVRNFKSLGVWDPQTNFNFVTAATGSFERLRQDISVDQPVTKSDASGDISLFDFSQNKLTLTGSGFEASTQVIKPERFDFEVLSSNFQSGENPNKVRIRSFINDETADKFEAALAPLYEINQSEQPQDDKRVSVEISLVQALNEDIMNIFSSLNALDNIIGSPELVFSQEYPNLRNLRRVYFNRLTDKINFQSFFEFFKWFDDTVGMLLEQMLPSDSRFLGTSYVIESHALERPKFSYNYYDIYLGENNRGGKDVILLQQFVATLRKM